MTHSPSSESLCPEAWSEAPAKLRMTVSETRRMENAKLRIVSSLDRRRNPAGLIVSASENRERGKPGRKNDCINDRDLRPCDPRNPERCSANLGAAVTLMQWNIKQGKR